MARSAPAPPDGLFQLADDQRGQGQPQHAQPFHEVEGAHLEHGLKRGVAKAMVLAVASARAGSLSTYSPSQ